MSGSSNAQPATNSKMTEAMRFAYLQAMDVDCWLPKSDLLAIEENLGDKIALTHEDKDTIERQLTKQLSNEPPGSDGLTDEVKKQPALEKAAQAEQANAAIDSKALSPIEGLSKSNNIAVENKAKISSYLKMVGWTNQNIRQENCKKLLIICRHQIDQPANSFARQNSPSQFMLDYINALLGLVQGPSFELKIQLAHLSEAGLSNDSIPMEDVLGDCQPDLILLLGDETAAHLLDKQTNVASLRGRLVDLKKNHKALVSYHPFSMIKNPGLKSLALDDLSNLANYLLQNNQA